MEKKLFLNKMWLGLVLMLIGFSGFAQNGKMSGRITEANGAPIVGASAVIKGTTTGTVSDVSLNCNT